MKRKLKLKLSTKKFNISNLLTIFRIILIPFIAMFMAMQIWWLALSLFVIAAITDILDGMLARALNETTLLGACLDPLADKILMISCYSVLAAIKIPFLKIPLWFVYLVLIKETLLVLGAVYLGVIESVVNVKPTILGKAAAVVQTFFIIWLCLCMIFHWVPLKTYHAVFALVITLIIASFFQYILIGYRGLMSWFIRDYYQ